MSSSSVSDAFRKATDHASKMKDKFVSSEHLLMGILDTDEKLSDSEGSWGDHEGAQGCSQ